MKQIVLKTTIILALSVVLPTLINAQGTFNKTYTAPNMNRHVAMSIALAVGEESDPDIYFSSMVGVTLSNENTLLTKADANGIPLQSVFFLV